MTVVAHSLWAFTSDTYRAAGVCIFSHGHYAFGLRALCQTFAQTGLYGVPVIPVRYFL